MASVVTISASYGARGDKVAPAVAERLGLPFIDRAIPADVAHEFDQLVDVTESRDEAAPSRWQRMLAGFASAATMETAPGQPRVVIETPERFRSAQEEKLRQIADSTGGVILGRAAMAVLGTRPDVLCVRLDGPVEARIARVISLGLDETEARRGQREVDKAREEYAQVFFNVRQDDPRLYHLILDSTVLSEAACVDLVVRAATYRFGPS